MPSMITASSPIEPPYEAALARERLRCAYADDPQITPIVGLAPGVIVVVVHRVTAPPVIWRTRSKDGRQKKGDMAVP